MWCLFSTTTLTTRILLIKTWLKFKNSTKISDNCAKLILFNYANRIRLILFLPKNFNGIVRTPSSSLCAMNGPKGPRGAQMVYIYICMYIYIYI